MRVLNQRLLTLAAMCLVTALPLNTANAKQLSAPKAAAHQTKSSQPNWPQPAWPPHFASAPTDNTASAGVPCGSRTDVVKMLHDNFGETPIGQGTADTGAKAEVFLSSKGTWTIIATSPSGTSCMVGSGQSWQPVVARDDTI